jgi:hypothetical protein
MVINFRYVLISLMILAFLAYMYSAAAGVRQYGRKRTRRAQIIGLIVTLVGIGVLSVF